MSTALDTINPALTRALHAIEGYRPIATALAAVNDALAELSTVDPVNVRAAIVAGTVDDLLAGDADLSVLGLRWLDPDRRIAEVDAQRTALATIAKALTGRADQATRAGADLAIADLAAQLGALIAAVPTDRATDEQVAGYDRIRRAQVWLGVRSGLGAVEQRVAQAVVDTGCVDRPELIDPHLIADLEGGEVQPAPWPAQGGVDWWPTEDRPAYLAWLAHRSPARPCVPTVAEMRASAARIREAVQAARQTRADNRYEPRAVRA